MTYIRSSKPWNREWQRGFSLVELLTVVAIITLLIAILVPAVNKVREKAKVMSTKTTLSTLDTGLQQYRQDEQIGGQMPPSASDVRDASNNLIYTVNTPYSKLTNDGSRFEITGAGLLVWALAGADLLGCPGFKDFGGAGGYWGNGTSDVTGFNPLGAYALDVNTLEPEHARVAPFVDLSKVRITKYNPNAIALEGRGSFEIPAEVEASRASDLLPHQRRYPMFIDDFGGPILYWRADAVGSRIADVTPSAGIVSGNNRKMRGIFHYRDNSELLDPDPAMRALMMTPNADEHKLTYSLGAAPPVDPADTLYISPSDTTLNFARYIRNTDVTAKLSPYNEDSFLLASAGPDGLFGTDDDITNFPHNGASLK